MKDEIKKHLITLQDKKYQDFSMKLGLNQKIKHLGIRIPLLRNYAKLLMKKNDFSLLIEKIDEEYYEEIMLKGMIISLNQKLTEQELFYYLNYYLPKISDWSLCDIFVSGLKITKKYMKELWPLIKKNAQSNKEYYVRFSLVMILNYYLKEEYLDEIYDIIQKIKLDKYYVKMAQAWLLSYLIIDYYDKTIAFLEKNYLDNFVYQKALSKAIESKQISEDKKQVLRKMKKI